MQCILKPLFFCAVLTVFCIIFLVYYLIFFLFPLFSYIPISWSKWLCNRPVHRIDRLTSGIVILAKVQVQFLNNVCVVKTETMRLLY